MSLLKAADYNFLTDAQKAVVDALESHTNHKGYAIGLLEYLVDKIEEAETAEHKILSALVLDEIDPMDRETHAAIERAKSPSMET